ncbi:MAG: VanW family protein [Lachnospiraceae bacterium]|nr:VanW family protein [Candidatus Colinaster scatohippi]
MKRLFLALTTISLLALLIPFMSKADNSVVQNGIIIGDINISGMTVKQAEDAVTESVVTAKNATLKVVCIDDKTADLSMSRIGLTWMNPKIVSEVASMGTKGNIVKRYKEKKDLEKTGAKFDLVYSLDEEALRSFVEEECLIYNKEAENSILEKTEDGFNIVGGSDGIVIDEDEAVDFLYKYILNEWNGQDGEVTLPVRVDKPLGNAEDLSQITDLLATFSTSYKTSGEDRSTNVANGCRLVNGTTLYPGEEFSMYDHIKPFSVENGYRMAGSYANGLVVESLGGGICQVSTTLYNAVIRAELEITERNNHSMIVTYVPASADAAIAESAGKDFKFKNNTEYPIYIEGYTTDEKRIVFNIYGKETRPANRTIEFESEVLETTPAELENIIPSSAYPVGYVSVQSAHTGYKAQLIKIVKIDDVEQSREVFNTSNYKMVPRTAVVGIATANSEAAAQMAEAIATGSIDYVKVVAATWAAAAAPPPTDANP